MTLKALSTTGLVLFVALNCGLVSPPQEGKRLWVLEGHGQVVVYDPPTWALVNRVTVPAEFMNDPPDLQINGLGQMLFCSDPRRPQAETAQN